MSSLELREIPSSVNQHSAEHDPLWRALYEMGDGNILINELESRGIAIHFFEIVNADLTWKAKAGEFLWGRILELVDTQLAAMTAVRAKGVAKAVFTSKEHDVARMLTENMPQTQTDRYKHHIRSNASLFKTFADAGKFIGIMNQCALVAGRLFERIRILYHLNLHLPANDADKYLMQEAYKKREIYLQKALLTPDDNGLRELVKLRLREGKFDALLEDLSELDIAWEVKALCLDDKDVDDIITDLCEWEAKIFTTDPKTLSFQALLAKIDAQFARCLETTKTKEEGFSPIISDKRIHQEQPNIFFKELTDHCEQPRFESEKKKIDFSTTISDKYSHHEQPNAFFKDLVQYSETLFEKKDYNKLLLMLYKLPMPVQFKRAIIFQQFRDEKALENTLNQFEEFRVHLCAQAKLGLYDTLNDMMPLAKAML